MKKSLNTLERTRCWYLYTQEKRPARRHEPSEICVLKETLWGISWEKTPLALKCLGMRCVWHNIVFCLKGPLDFMMILIPWLNMKNTRTFYHFCKTMLRNLFLTETPYRPLTKVPLFLSMSFLLISIKIIFLCVNLLLIKLARDCCGRILALVLFCTDCLFCQDLGLIFWQYGLHAWLIRCISCVIQNWSWTGSKSRVEGPSSLWICYSSCWHEQGWQNPGGRSVCWQAHPSVGFHGNTRLGRELASAYCDHQGNSGENYLHVSQVVVLSWWFCYKLCHSFAANVLKT